MSSSRCLLSVAMSGVEMTSSAFRRQRYRAIRVPPAIHAAGKSVNMAGASAARLVPGGRNSAAEVADPGIHPPDG
jgi:hypothetical protein